MKTQVKHTPGPWEIHDRYTGTNIHPIMKDNGNGSSTGIADVFGIGGTVNSDKANARLIASSPELLEACKTVEWHLSRYPKENDPALANGIKLMLNKTREAIAKAEGGSK